MSKEIVTKSEFTIQLEEFDKIQETCRKLLQTKHYQNLGESGIHAIMARAKALGIHPFEALNGSFYVVQGRVGMSTEMMAALVRQRGHSIQKDPKSTNECVILHGKRGDNGDTWTCTFSKDDAIAAGLWGTATWKKYPTVMLYNRCMSQLFRQLFPDLSLGAGYVEDELKEIAKVDEYSKNSIDVSVEHVKQDVKPLYIANADTTLSQQKVDTNLSQEVVETITSDQCNDLREILLECEKGLIEKLCKHFKIDVLDDMPAKRFDEVKARCVEARVIYQGALLKAAQDGE
jgi:hypothetical protein